MSSRKRLPFSTRVLLVAILFAAGMVAGAALRADVETARAAARVPVCRLLNDGQLYEADVIVEQPELAGVRFCGYTCAAPAEPARLARVVMVPRSPMAADCPDAP